MIDSLEHPSSSLFAKIWDRHVIAGSDGAVLLGLDRFWAYQAGATA